MPCATVHFPGYTVPGYLLRSCVRPALDGPLGYIASGYPGTDGGADPVNGMSVGTSTDGATFDGVGGSNGIVYSVAAGVRDSAIIYWEGRWYGVHSNTGPAENLELHFIVSDDLVNWAALYTLSLADFLDGGGNVAVCQFLIDGDGLHVLGVADGSSPSHIPFCIDLLGDIASVGSWSAATALTGPAGAMLVQGNTYVAFKNGVYYMAFNAPSWAGYRRRTSSSLKSGWSADSALGISTEADDGDSLNLIVDHEGNLRFYACRGNLPGANVGEPGIWYWTTETTNWSGSVTWSAAQSVSYTTGGSWDSPNRWNWLQFTCTQIP